VVVALTRWNQLKQDVADAHSLDDLKDIRDKAEAIRLYAKRQKDSLDMQNKFAEITLRCERRMGEMLQEMPKQHGVILVESHCGTPLSHDTTVLPTTLEELGITKNSSSRWQTIARIPEPVFEQHIEVIQNKQEELTQASLLKLAKQFQKEANKCVRQDLFEKTEIQLDDCPIYPCSVADLHTYVEAGSVDAIITDPPYPKEFLPVYTDLAKFAAYALKPGGSLLVMIGQSYLPQILEAITPYVPYHWIVSYLTPGGQSTQLWQKKVNTFWKPILWFIKGTYAGNWIGDVCKSNVNDNDKKHHHWGQSESGMADIIERFTLPAQLICDPFVGGGTTPLVATQLKRRFVGCDINEPCVEKACLRVKEALHEQL
jgi:site-specific DNA-methyltransferase (adenine-specific)